MTQTKDNRASLAERIRKSLAIIRTASKQEQLEYPVLFRDCYAWVEETKAQEEAAGRHPNLSDIFARFEQTFVKEGRGISTVSSWYDSGALMQSVLEDSKIEGLEGRTVRAIFAASKRDGFQRRHIAQAFKMAENGQYHNDIKKFLDKEVKRLPIKRKPKGPDTRPRPTIGELRSEAKRTLGVAERRYPEAKEIRVIVVVDGEERVNTGTKR